MILIKYNRYFGFTILLNMYTQHNNIVYSTYAIEGENLSESSTFCSCSLDISANIFRVLGSSSFCITRPICFSSSIIYLLMRFSQTFSVIPKLLDIIRNSYFISCAILSKPHFFFTPFVS